MKKVCSVCLLEKEEIDFWKRAGKTDGLQDKCKNCQRLYLREYYSLNKESIKKRTGKRREENRDMLRKIVVEYLLQHPCIDCGEKDIVVLDFDHISDNKIDSVSRMMLENVPTQRLLDEMAKCVIRCANCHRRKTAKDFGWSKLDINIETSK